MKVAIVGVSGAVGQEFLKVLEQRDFPLDELEIFGSARSAGNEYTFKGKKYVVKEGLMISFLVLIDETFNKYRKLLYLLKEQDMKSSAFPFNDIVEKVYGLPLEEKLELKNLLEHHISDERRNEIFANYKKTIEEQKSGKLKFSTSVLSLKKML